MTDPPPTPRPSAPTPDVSPSHSSTAESLRPSTVTRAQGSDSTATTGRAGTAGQAGTDAWRRAWDAWHEARWAAVSAPYGTAALADTVWLFPQEQEIEGLAGRWSTDGEHVVGTGLRGSAYTDAAGAPVDDTVALAGGEELRAGDVLLRAFVRDGVPALRLFDPHVPGRMRLQRIDAYEPDPAWAVEAAFVPRDEPVGFDHIDGHRSVAEHTGTLEFELAGSPTRLTATVLSDTLWVVFADATSGTETYRFRFLHAALPDAAGRTTVDFTRAFLPPCAFSDHYVCPLPPPGNRLQFPVRAGERLPVRTET
ncbi:DUF1684 domain-containing protein [Microbacterium sp.]|uniref:DUF1684 domain-containing protein n=1 Tax=Microbacterium sp. TaxID=51671 RepID=UPI0039E729E6